MRSAGSSGVLSLLKRHENKLCILSYFAGVVLILSWSTSLMHNKTYISENALQPGVVEEQFYDSSAAINFLNDLRNFAADRAKEFSGVELSAVVLRYVEERFAALRNVDTQLHNFTIEYPRIFAAQSINSQNLVAVARSKRTAHTESVIIAVPYRLPAISTQKSAAESEQEEDTFASIALVYALFKQLRSSSFWSRDLIFVLHANGPVGLEAFLDAYHDTRTSSWLRTAALRVHGGAVQCAIALELTSFGTMRYVDLLLAGLHGRLPNLDLVNVAVRVGAKHGLTARIHGVGIPGSVGFDDDYDEQLASNLQFETAMRRVSAIGAFVHAQAAASTLAGNHALFGRFAIESLTLKFVRAPSAVRANVQAGTNSSPQAVLSVARFIEALLRSVNNAMERFHQSYFFYVMAGADRFVSIGTYYPAFALLTLSLLLRALTTYNDLLLTNRESTDSDSEAKKPTEDVKEEEASEAERLLITFVDRRYSATLGSRFFAVVPLLLAIALFATVSYTSSSYFLYLATSFSLQQSDALMLGLASVCFASLFYPRYFVSDFSMLSINRRATAPRTGPRAEQRSNSEDGLHVAMLRSCVDELAQLRSTLTVLKQSAGVTTEADQPKPSTSTSDGSTTERLLLSELEFVYDYRVLAICVYVFAALYLHCVAMFNISLAVLLALIYVPLIAFIARPHDLAADTARQLAARQSFSARVKYALRSRLPFVAKLLGFALASPLTVVTMCAFFKYSGTAATSTLGPVRRWAKATPAQLYADVCSYVLRLFVDEAFFGSWQLMLITLGLVPIWLGGYTLIWMSRKPAPEPLKVANTKPKTE